MAASGRLILLLLEGTVALRYGFRARPLGMKIPDSVASLIPEAVRDLEVTERNWLAVVNCFPTEEAAQSAVTDNVALVVPYGFDAANRASNIAGSYEVLRELLDDDAEVLDVITKNPGVLGCVPQQLANSTARDIRLAANVASGAAQVFGPAKRFLTSLDWWDEKSKSVLVDGQLRPVGTANAGIAVEEEEEEIEFEELEFDGETFLFDAAGAYNGEKNLLLAKRGEEWDARLAKSRPVWEPYGTWDPETEMLEEYLLVDDDDAA